METPRRELISRLYHAALERRPAERSAFLKEACAGDTALQEELDSLLRHGPAASRFLEIPAAQIVAHAHEPDPDMVGRQLGPYKISALLGAGGMGEVYRARDTKLGRDVAIKILPADFTADPERRARFAREARLLATLNHPHIGAIYGLEESDTVAALVLEFVDGPTLADRLTHGPLPIAEALAIARQIAEALEAAHDKGIVHRDLKPANVILQGGGGGTAGPVRAKVLDFGLAKPMAMNLAADLTRASARCGTEDGRILGTPAYMSPEQARGRLLTSGRTSGRLAACSLRCWWGAEHLKATRFPTRWSAFWNANPTGRRCPPILPFDAHTAAIVPAKRSQKRLHDVADARIELDEIDPPLRSSAAAGSRRAAPSAARMGHRGAPRCCPARCRQRCRCSVPPIAARRRFG